MGGGAYTGRASCSTSLVLLAYLGPESTPPDPRKKAGDQHVTDKRP
nr:MAG TPA: hypothetical protein [Caudoviricetes sp.]